MIYSLVQSKNVMVVEHAIKLLSTLLLANPKVKQMLGKMRGFDIIAHRLGDKVPTFSFLQTLLDFAVGDFKVQALYPQNNSYVSTVINRSPIASEVISSQTGTAKGSTPGLANAEVLEMLFAALGRTTELHYRINVLRQLQGLFSTGIVRNLTLAEQDAQRAIDAGIFVWIVECFKCLETEQQQLQQTNEMAAEALRKVAKMMLKILCGILVSELEKPPKHCKAVRILQSIPSVDHIQGLVLDRLFKSYCKPEALKKEPANLIKNLASVPYREETKYRSCCQHFPQC